MQAVILAGGQGSRLRPLTCGLPKPLVPVLNRPVMGYTIDLLRSHGIQDIGVTLHYQAKRVVDAFGTGEEHGVKLTYFEETRAMGTAGSVLDARKFFQGSFLVIRGDGVWDFDLTQAMAFHRERGALVTMVLSSKVNNPKDKWIAAVDDSGRVVQWGKERAVGGLIPGLVSTGVYFMEPEVFSFFSGAGPLDFGQDVFPHLLEREVPVFGWEDQGYWNDLEDVGQYLLAQRDLLERKARIRPPGEEREPGVWVGKNVEIHPKAKIIGPVVLGDGSWIEEGAEMEASVVGDHTVIGPGASVKQSAVWHHSYVGAVAQVRGAVLGARTKVMAKASIFEGAAVGDGCLLGVESVIKPEVKIWPGKRVEDQGVVSDSLVWGQGLPRKLFYRQGVRGVPNVEITPDIAAKLAAAFGTILGQGARVVIGGDSHPFTAVIKKGVLAGILAAGIDGMEVGVSPSAITRFAVKVLGADGGIHMRLSEQGEMILEFLDNLGLYLEDGEEERMAEAFRQEDYRRAPLSRIGHVQYMPHLADAYLQALLGEINTDAVRRRRFKLVAEYSPDNLGGILRPLFDRLGIQCLTIEPGEPRADLSRLGLEMGADFAVVLNCNGELEKLWTDDGREVSPDLMLVMLAMAELHNRDQALGVPVTAPSAVELMVESLGGRVFRCGTQPRELMAAESGSLRLFQPLFDGIYGIARLLDFLAGRQLTLSQVMDSIPSFAMHREVLPCPYHHRNQIMARLKDKVMGETVKMKDGLKVFREQGWVLLQPDPERPRILLLSQGPTGEQAREWAQEYARIIEDLKQEG